MKLWHFLLCCVAFAGGPVYGAYTTYRTDQRHQAAAHTKLREEHEAQRTVYRVFREDEWEIHTYSGMCPGRARNVTCVLDMEHIDPVWACFVDVAHRDRHVDFVCRRVRGRMHCIHDYGYLPGHEPRER